MKYLLLCAALAVLFVAGCDNMMGRDSAGKKDDIPIAVYSSL